MLAALARRHPDWKGHFRDGPVVSGLCFPMAQPPCKIWDALHSCRCAACWTCLKRAGVLDGL